MADPRIIDAQFSTVETTQAPPAGSQVADDRSQYGYIPGARPLLTRDAIAMTAVVTAKLCGAHWLSCIAIGFGLRIGMNAIDWPAQCVVAPIGGVDPRELLSMAAGYAAGKGQ